MAGIARPQNSVQIVDGKKYPQSGAGIQAAINALGGDGKIILPAGTYTEFSSCLTWNARIDLGGVGPATVLKSDTQVICVKSAGAAGSHIHDMDLEPVSTITAVTPSGFPTSKYPVSVDRFGDGIGYEPSPNDVDLTGKFTKNQLKENIGPGIQVSNADEIVIERITGNRVELVVSNSNKSIIRYNHFVGNGKNSFLGCILMGFNSSPGTLKGDTVSDNFVRDCAFSGISVGDTLGVEIANNQSIYNGESGIKTFQPFSTNGNVQFQIRNNDVDHNWYDGIDASAGAKHTCSDQTSGNVAGNKSTNNGQTGITTDGLSNTVTGNDVENNQNAGINYDVSNGILAYNVFRNNNRANAATGVSEINVGISCTVAGSLIAFNRMSHKAANGGAIATSSLKNRFISNVADGARDIFLGGHPEESIGNIDSTGPLNDYFSAAGPR
jgi:hypothetical protein